MEENRKGLKSPQTVFTKCVVYELKLQQKAEGRRGKTSEVKMTLCHSQTRCRLK